MSYLYQLMRGLDAEVDTILNDMEREEREWSQWSDKNKLATVTGRGMGIKKNPQYQQKHDEFWHRHFQYEMALSRYYQEMSAYERQRREAAQALVELSEAAIQCKPANISQ